MQIKKIVTKHGDPLDSTLHYLEKHPADLLVLATHSYEGAARWMHKMIAEPLSRQSGAMTLFFPRGARGFVSRDDGSVSLTNILIPIDHRPPPQQAVAAGCEIAQAFGATAVTFTLVHVCGDGDVPAVSTQPKEGWMWREILVQGDDVVAAIAEAASSVSADPIVMATAGHEGVLDALRGSTTEQVIRGSHYPVLAVPTRPPVQAEE